MAAPKWSLPTDTHTCLCFHSDYAFVTNKVLQKWLCDFGGSRVKDILTLPCSLRPLAPVAREWVLAGDTSSHTTRTSQAAKEEVYVENRSLLLMATQSWEQSYYLHKLSLSPASDDCNPRQQTDNNSRNDSQWKCPAVRLLNFCSTEAVVTVLSH